MKTPGFLLKNAKFLVSLLLLSLVFVSVDISKIGQDLKSFSAKSLIVVCMLCWAGQLLCSERWRIFAQSLQMPGSYLSFVRAYFAGMFFNIGLPSLVGGDFIKAYIVSRRAGKQFQVGLASVLLDRAAGLISLLVYGSIAVVFAPMSWKGIPLWSAYAISWLAIAVVLLLVVKGDRLYRRFLDPGSRALFQLALQRAADFHKALALSNLTPGQVLRIVVFSFVYSGLVLWAYQQVTVAAGHGVGIVEFSVLFPLIAIGTMLPVTLGGIGIREWLYVEGLALAGVPGDQALLIALTTSALCVVINLGGIPFLPSVPSEIRSRGEQERAA